MSRESRFSNWVLMLPLLLVGCAGGTGEMNDDEGDDGQGGDAAGGRDASDSGGAGGDVSMGGAGGEPAGGENGSAGGQGGTARGGAGGMAQSAGSGGMPVGGNGGNPDAKPVFPPCPSGNICDDFEKGSVGQMPSGWSKNTRSGDVKLATSRAYSGNKSLAMTVSGGSAMAYAIKKNAPLFPAKDNAFFGRMMVYVKSVPTTKVHWDIIEGSGPLQYNGKTTRAFYRYGGGGGPNILANYDLASGGADCYKRSGVPFPEGKWTCVQWHFDGAKNEMSYWLNGQPLTSVRVRGRGHGCIADYDDLWHAPTFDTVSLGWRQHQDAGAQEMWVDDVALGSEPTPCPEVQ